MFLRLFLVGLFVQIFKQVHGSNARTLTHTHTHAHKCAHMRTHRTPVRGGGGCRLEGEENTVTSTPRLKVSFCSSHPAVSGDLVVVLLSSLCPDLTLTPHLSPGAGLKSESFSSKVIEFWEPI